MTLSGRRFLPGQSSRQVLIISVIQYLLTLNAQGTVKFMSIIREFSKMLSSIPHDQAFTQLLISQIMNFYDKCCGWYKGERS